MPSWRISLSGSASSRPGTPAPARPRSAILLAGDAGVGKTRLLTALRDRAIDLGWQVIAGHCLDFGDSALPYLPFSEILGRLQATTPELLATVAAHHPALHRLAPGRRMIDEAADGGASGGASIDKAALFEAVHALFEAAAEQQPLVLVVEDLHWADQSTRDLMSFLFTRPFSQPVALVASYRSDDLHRKHPLRAKVAEWSRLQNVHRMSLEPLDAAEVRELVACLRAPAPAPCSPTTRSTWSSSAPRATRSSSRSWSAPPPAPTTTPCPPTSPRCCWSGSTASTRPRARSCAPPASPAAGSPTSCSRSPPTPTTTPSSRACARPSSATSWSPATGTTPSATRCSARPSTTTSCPASGSGCTRKFAAAIGDGRARGTAAELARHARLAHDEKTALKASIQAGHEAAQVGGPDEAAQHFERALRLLAGLGAAGDGLVDRGRLAVDTAEALSSSGHPERAAALLAEQLAALPADASPTERGTLLAARAVALTAFETMEDPPAISAEAVRIAPDDDSLARARVLAAHAHVLAMFWRHQEAQQVGLDALALADKLNRTDLAAEVITTLSGLRLGTTKERLREALREAIDRTVETGAVHAELRGRYLLARSYQDWGELDEAERWFRSSVERAESAGIEWAPYASGARWHLTWVLLTRGDWDGVLKLTDLTGNPGSHPPPMARAMFASLRAVVRVARGEDLTDELRGLRPMWRLDGAWPCTPRPRRSCSRPARATPPPPRRPTTTSSA